MQNKIPLTSEEVKLKETFIRASKSVWKINKSYKELYVHKEMVDVEILIDLELKIKEINFQCLRIEF